MEKEQKEVILRIFKYRNFRYEIKDERIDLHGLRVEESYLILDIRIPQI